MSAQIEKERKTYYDQLEAQQRSTLNLTPWLIWFMDCLARAFNSAESTLEAVLYKARLCEKANRLRSQTDSAG